MLRLKHFHRLITSTTLTLKNPKYTIFTPQLTYYPLQRYSDFHNEAFNDQPDDLKRGKTRKSMVKSASGESEFKDLDDFFRSKIGKTKSELLDSWLEMDNESLQKECKTLQVKNSDKHIENIQNLFDYLKKLEAQAPSEFIKKEQPNMKWKSVDREEQVQPRRNERIYEEQDQQYRTQYPQQQQSKNLFRKNLKTRVEVKDEMLQPRKGYGAVEEYENEDNSNQSIFSKQQVFQNQTQQRDVQKAKESLNEQLQKILNKRNKANQAVVQMEESYQAQHQQMPREEAAEFSSHEQVVSNVIHNQYKHSKDYLRKMILKRGNLIHESFHQFQTQSDEQNVVDSVFGLHPDKIDTKFKAVTQDCGNSIIGQMSLTLEDFSKTQSITKKKIMMNLDSIKRTFQTNQNFMLNSNHDNFLTFSKDNFALLNQESKELIKTKINEISQNLSQHKTFVNDINKLSSLVYLTKQLNMENADILRKQLTSNSQWYLDTEQMDTPQKGIQAAKLIQFLSEPEINAAHIDLHKSNLSQIKTGFHQSMKRLIAKKSIKSFNFREQIVILKALPKVETDNPGSQKYLHYSLLNEILSPGNQDYWSKMEKGDIVEIMGRCQQLSSHRDLQNKLRSSLLQVNGQVFSIEDMKEVCEMLSEGGKLGKLDIKIVVNMIRRNIKTTNYFPNTNELRKYVEFYEYIYNFSPLTYSYLTQEMKFLQYRLKELSNSQYLNLKDIVKLSKILLPSMFTPNLFFNEMVNKNVKYLDENNEIATKNQSFKRDSDLTDLYELVNQIQMRVQETQYSFEHLYQSHSRIHRHYKPYDQSTVTLLLKVFNDMIEGDMNYQELQITNKILSNEILAKRLFFNHDTLLKMVKPVIQSTLDQSKLKLTHIQKEKLEDYNINKFGSTSPVNFEDWNNQFKALTTTLQLSTNHELLQNVKEITKNQLQLLKHELTQAQDFSLDEILKLNKSVLELIEQLKESHHDKNLKINEGLENITELIESALNFHYQGMKPFILSFDSNMKNKQMSKKIHSEVNASLIEQNLDSIIAYLNATNLSNGKQLALQICQKMSNGRNFVGKELLNLFKMISKYGITEDVKPLIVNVAANLETIDYYRIQGAENEQDQIFTELNQQLDEKESENKKRIIKKYMQIQQNMSKDKDDYLGKEENTLRPLSKLMADVFDVYTDEDILGATALPKLQAEILSILTQQNVMHQDLMETHFETFIKMKDKQSVSNYLKDFLQYSAYLGFTKFDIEKCTQVFRRIYHTPEKVPEVSQLLDLLVVLAQSGAFYQEFEAKSANFIEQSLEFIEKKFTGIQTLEVVEEDPLSGEKETFLLNYYKSIPSANKIYHKVQIPGPLKVPIDLQKAVLKSTRTEEIAEEEKVDANETSEILESLNDDKSIDNVDNVLGLDPDEQHTINEVQRKAKEIVDKERYEKYGSIKVEESQEEEENDEKTEQDENMIENEDIGMTDEQQKLHKISEMANKKNMTVYQRKASESLYSEELEFHQYRKKKLQDMDKKSKHLLLFSNINQLNFVDINKSDTVKAWTVLFHFKSKSFDSIIYDEFESITMRNTTGKGKSHELFSKFYLKLVEKSYELGYRMQLATKCEQTGWPIDINISLNADKNKKINLFFFLQEEVCLNTKDETEEPLGLQKLMMKHIKHQGQSDVQYVTENQFYMNKEFLEPFVNDVLTNKMGIVMEEKSSEFIMTPDETN